MDRPRSLAQRLVGSLALGAAIALVIGVVIVLVAGRPPHTIRIAAGAQGGAYLQFAESLRDDLAPRGFTVEIIETAGSLENAALLTSGQADVGLAQSGTDQYVDMTGLTAISELFYEPLWVFYRTDRVPSLEKVADLEGHSVGIGPAGSGSNALARTLLGIFRLGEPDITIVEAGTTDMLAKMQEGTLDVAVVVASAAAPIVSDFARAPDVAMWDYVAAEAYARRFPFFSSTVVPQAVVSFSPVQPPVDLATLSVRATLMAKKDIHPDIARLLAAATERVLAYPLVGNPTAFPGLQTTLYPPNEDAARYYQEGPTALEQFLPFEVASPLSRWWVLLLPLFVLIFPLYTLAKAAWSWYNSSRIVGWYPRLHWIERNLERFSEEQLQEQLDFVRNLDATLPSRTRVSAGYLSAYYDLRTTTRFVEARLRDREAELRAMEAAGAATPADFDEAPPESPELPGETTAHAGPAEPPERAPDRP